MKKFTSMLLSLILICGVFAGCADTGTATPNTAGNDAPAAGDTGDDSAPAPDADGVDINEDGTVNNPEDVQVDANDLVLWSLFSGGDGAYMDRIVSDYNAQTSGRKVTSIMLVWADYYTKLATAVAANKGPDIGISHVSKLPELVSQGIVVPFDAEADAVGVNWGDFDASILDSVTFGGEKFAMPLDTHAELMYYNLDLLEEAGVSLTGGQLDLGKGDDFLANLAEMKDNLPDGVSPIVVTSKGDDPYRMWWAFYFQMGGTPLVSEDGSEVTLDAEIAQRAIDYIKVMYDEKYIIEGVADDHNKVFQAGQGAIFFGGTWTTGVFEETQGLNFGAQAFPTVFDQVACWADAHTMIIPFNKNRDDDKTRDAVDFVNFVTSEGGLTWAGSGQIPSNNKVLDSAEYKALPFRSDYAEAAKDAVYPSSNENFYEIKELIIRNLDSAWAGQSDSATVVDNIVSEIGTAIR